MPFQPCSSTAHADWRPAPRGVDVVRQRDDEALRRLHTELLAQTLERRIERLEVRPLRGETVVLVRWEVEFLDTREMEECLGEVIAFRPLASVDPVPRGGVVRHVVAEAEVGRADGVEYPPRTPLDGRRDHRRALRTTRARWTKPGRGSSRAKTAST